MRERYRWSNIVGGGKKVVETDDPAEYLRCRIDAMAGDFSVASDVRVTQFGGEWLLVVVAPAAPSGRAESLRFAEFTEELSHIFGAFYECRGHSQEGASRTWRVRHLGDCPWV